MQLQSGHYAIATPKQTELYELVYCLAERVSTLESRLNYLERENRMQTIKIEEAQEQITEIGESFDTLVPNYRYLEDRNADLEALASFHYPND